MLNNLPEKFANQLRKDKRSMCAQLIVWPVWAGMATNPWWSIILYSIYTGIVIYFCIGIHGLLQENSN